MCIDKDTPARGAAILPGTLEGRVLVLLLLSRIANSGHRFAHRVSHDSPRWRCLCKAFQRLSIRLFLFDAHRLEQRQFEQASLGFRDVRRVGVLPDVLAICLSRVTGHRLLPLTCLRVGPWLASL